MRVYLVLVALSAGASASPSLADASTPVEVAELHAERELMTRAEAKTRQLQRKLPKVKAKREKADAKVKKVEDALELPHSVTEAVAANVDGTGCEEEVAAATKDLFTQDQVTSSIDEAICGNGGVDLCCVCGIGCVDDFGVPVANCR